MLLAIAGNFSHFEEASLLCLHRSHGYILLVLTLVYSSLKLSVQVYMLCEYGRVNVHVAVFSRFITVISSSMDTRDMDWKCS